MQLECRRSECWGPQPMSALNKSRLQVQVHEPGLERRAPANVKITLAQCKILH